MMSHELYDTKKHDAFSLAINVTNSVQWSQRQSNWDIVTLSEH
jgi:hypothetical protein